MTAAYRKHPAAAVCSTCNCGKRPLPYGACQASLSLLYMQQSTFRFVCFMLGAFQLLMALVSVICDVVLDQCCDGELVLCCCATGFRGFYAQYQYQWGPVDVDLLDRVAAADQLISGMQLLSTSLHCHHLGSRFCMRGAPLGTLPR